MARPETIAYYRTPNPYYHVSYLKIFQNLAKFDWKFKIWYIMAKFPEVPMIRYCEHFITIFWG